MAEPVVAVLVTMNSKAGEGRFVREALERAGARPWLVDLSLRPHEVAGADVSGGEVAAEAGVSWEALAGMDRAGATETMIAGGRKVVERMRAAGGLAGAIGVGGANGTALACGVMRALPLLVPKVMVSVVASTGAVPWYVGESDIAMFPSIGDLSLNRITRGVMENAARAVAAMAAARTGAAGRAGPAEGREGPPLVGVSSFGGTAGCVGRVEGRLREAGYEVILFHASGGGGRALESLARAGELAGVVDVTTHELTDLVVDGVYSAGDGRLRAAGEAGLPQVVVPGALDHANFWTGQVPGRFRARGFVQYNAENVLMRTSAEEYEALGELIARRLSAARGPAAVLVPLRGFSEHTRREVCDLDGRPLGPWHQPEADAVLVKALRRHLGAGVRVEELDLHINDPAFGDACADAFLEMMRK